MASPAASGISIATCSLLTDSQANARLSAARLPPTDTFLDSFFTDDWAIHLHQIQHNLKVLSPGRRYADQAIEAIRAMVSLDSQKQQLEQELDQKQTAREQNLRKNLAILASGFSISGVAASSRSRPRPKNPGRHEELVLWHYPPATDSAAFSRSLAHRYRRVRQPGGGGCPAGVPELVPLRPALPQAAAQAQPPTATPPAERR